MIFFLIFGFFFFIGLSFWKKKTRMMSDYKVEMINDGMHEFYVHFNGPIDSKSSYPYLNQIFFSSPVEQNFEVFSLFSHLGLC